MVPKMYSTYIYAIQITKIVIATQRLYMHIFRMESTQLVIASFQLGDLLASVDIKDAYLRVIFSPSRRYLCYVVDE